MKMPHRRLIIVWLTCAAAFAGRAQNIGNVIAWGDNRTGQTNVPVSLTDAVAIAAGTDHNLAVRANGTVIAWGGDNSSGQLSVPPGLNGVMAVAAGGYHSLALRSNGTVVAWGLSDAGQTNIPPGLAGVRAIGAGEYHSVALRSNGTVVAWGNNAYRQTSVPGNLANAIAIAVGLNHTLALRNNGTVVAWGDGTFGKTNIPPGLGNIVSIAAGGNHSLALRSDGAIIGWGNNFYQQLTVPPAAGGATSVFAGNHHSGVLKANGTVVCWGDNSLGQTAVPAALSNAILAASHAEHSLAVYLDPVVITSQPAGQTVLAGTPVTFTVGVSGSPPYSFQWRKDGANIAGATNANYSIADAQSTHAGEYTVRISNRVGAVVSAGARLVVNSPPLITEQPAGITVAEGTPITLTVAATGNTPLQYYWRKNGSVVSVTSSPFFAISSAQPPDSGSYSVIVSNAFGIATSAPATVTVFALPEVLQQPEAQAALPGSSVTLRTVVTNATQIQWLKDGTNVDGATAGFYAITRVAPGDFGTYHAMAWNEVATTHTASVEFTMAAPVAPDSIVMWGQTSSAADMTPPAGIGDVVAVLIGGTHNLAVRLDGSVVGWGENGFGQAGLPPSLRPEALAAGGSHTLALTNGTVAGFGLNAYQQLTMPDLSNVVAVAAGDNFSMALLSNGTVEVWGDNTAGQHSVPPGLTSAVFIAAGVEHCLALRRDGTVAGWGGNSFGQARPPFAVTNAAAGVAAIAAGGFHSLALKSNGTIVVWGKSNYGQALVPGEATNIIAIAAGLDHCLALRIDGRVFAWGRNSEGQTEVPAALVAVGIAAGDHRSAAIGREPFLFNPPQRLTSNRVRISFRHANGTGIDAARLNRLAVYAAPGFPVNPADWTRITATLQLIDGRVVFEEEATEARRFYFVTEQP